MSSASNLALLQSQIQSTAGAIPVLNEKGEVSMQKVKVFRYVSGRRPKYAPEESSEGETDDEFPFEKKPITTAPEPPSMDDEEALKQDPRLRRLLQRDQEDDDAEDRIERHRHIHEPAPAEEADEEELDDDEIERRRMLLKMKAQEKAQEDELLDLEDDEHKSDPDLSENSEYEEYSDSEEETEQRLKPVFVRKTETILLFFHNCNTFIYTENLLWEDRVTVQDKELQVQKEKELEILAKKQAEERRRQTLRIVEEEAKKERMEQQEVKNASDLVITDDENDEAAYEAWKLRELKRIKRDKDIREGYEKEKMEIDRIHSLTEEERRAEQRANPRLVTNKAAKGKYKFLQKYYHRGAFFLDNEDDIYRRDFSAPTLEDHFDKTILPKVMQVKNFGRSGRTNIPIWLIKILLSLIHLGWLKHLRI
ncbi:microfibrillar-associated protein 1 [Trichonephila inaurata madagascariensis]|uniref:Microfibrillar-associated protein 1 n=1 Tax=Trichonephila inaurata madagascariensis TaxID=2747483 RepID=A0A8X6I806_9ARAC|nr:microfibrillar-associated protein 1 [Trichonephila inaurata madagascariensis]